MAKKQASNTTAKSLTQAERKKLGKEKAIRTAAAAEEEEVEANETETKKPSLMADIPKTPQERFLIWFYHFYKKNLTTNIFVEVGIIALAIQQCYLAFFPQYEENGADLGLCISSLCGILANLFAFFIIFKSRDTLPAWNTVYLLFLPIFLSFVFNKDLILYNTAFTMASLDLPIIARFFIQFTVINSNSEYGRYPALNAKWISIHLLINYLLGRVSELKSWDTVENNLFSILIVDLFLIESDAIHVIILQKLFISFCAGLLAVYGISQLIKQNNLIRSLLMIVSWTGTFVYGSLYQLNPILEGDCINWLFKYVSNTETRVHIITVWLGSLLLLIPTIFNYKIKLSANFRRKIWHFLVLILIAYPLYLDPEFVQLSLAGTMILFLIVEMIRYLNLYPLGEYLNSNLRQFADFRDDKGPIIISYIYLFLGITFPILVSGSPIGLIALGVGDSMASIVGSKYGLLKWSNSNKTMEGTMAFIIASFAVASVFKWLNMFFLDKSYHALLLTCTLSGILEGSSSMNDNIMIPGFMLILLEALK